MYTSDKSALTNCIGCIAASIFLAFFGAIYELFSHEVYSYYMIYAFAIPLVLGAVPYGWMALKDKVSGRALFQIWNCALATFSIGSIFKGILDIYGTTNRLIIVYPVAGVVLCVFLIARFVMIRASTFSR